MEMHQRVKGWALHISFNDLILILDVWIGKQTLKERHRIKRFAALAKVVLKAARALFKSFRPIAPRITKSGGKITKQYFRKGDFTSAKRDFETFMPSNVKHVIKKDVSDLKWTKLNVSKSIDYKLGYLELSFYC